MITKKTIAVVDCGLGNLYSLSKALKLFTDAVVVSSDPDVLRSADALVLPGVGAFAIGMEGLATKQLIEPLKAIAERGTPILGICLGAQLLLDTGFEFGEHPGLGLIPGRVEAFPPEVSQNDKVPHIGWSGLLRPEQVSWEGTILVDLREHDDVYFVHSYIMIPKDPIHTLAYAEYGGQRFCAVIKKGNVYGAQFHPEKSGEVGLRIIQRFVNQIH